MSYDHWCRSQCNHYEIRFVSQTWRKTNLDAGLHYQTALKPSSVQTMTGDKININGKCFLNITFADVIYHHVAYIADKSDPFILRLNFLRENNFKLDFKNNKLHSNSEGISDEGNMILKSRLKKLCFIAFRKFQIIILLM